MEQENTYYLDKLSDLTGIESEFINERNERQYLSAENKRILLKAMDLEAGDETIARATLEMLELQPWQKIAPPVSVVKTDALPASIVITLPVKTPDAILSWVLEEEAGQIHTGSVRVGDMLVEAYRSVDGQMLQRCAFTLPVLPSLGYHTLRFTFDDAEYAEDTMSLIVVPPRCYMPSGLDRDINTWGFPVQLYALRSERNWGMGDFTDLSSLVDISDDLGAGFVGINPINTLFPDNPENAGPYGSSSRYFLNDLYIDVERVEEYAASKEAQEKVASESFQKELARLRALDQIDYTGVSALKRPVMEALFAAFRRDNFKDGAPVTPRGEAYEKFRAHHGRSLEGLATFQALAEKIGDGEAAPDWREWPEEYRDSSSDAVRRFKEESRDRIDFFLYLQYVADQQLADVAATCWQRNMEVGLYQDLAVGVAGNSAETWTAPEFFAKGVFVGAPPDMFNPKGQEWGLSPFNPLKLQELAYKPFIDIMHATMRFAGALRLDHVMSLMRLYWVKPTGGEGVTGSYVYYPLEDLLGIVCLESHRRRCVVIGESLGAVPPGFLDKLEAASILSFRVMRFEQDKEEPFEYVRPDDYPAEAIAALGTHDTSTFPAFWCGDDIELFKEHGLLKRPGDDDVAAAEKDAHTQRLRDKTKILEALQSQDLWGEIKDGDLSTDAVPDGLNENLHRYLARTACPLLLVQLEDVLEQYEQVNLPGTYLEHPNWRQRLPVSLEALKEDSRVIAMAAAMNEERPVPAQLDITEEEKKRPPVPAVPTATYRLQFSPSFIMHDAERLVPYFRALGITHIYASPIFKAVTGSEHGYNIVDHTELNPELGGEDALKALSQTLKRNGIGLIADFVPNHMGITQGENIWWQHVLEWGKESPYADYFDIFWHPPKKELVGKILMPLLGEHYGAALENGAFHLAFDQSEGSFSIFYADNRFPIWPLCYGEILGRAIDREEGVPACIIDMQKKFAALADKAVGPARIKAAEALKRGLAACVESDPAASEALSAALQYYNGTHGDGPSYQALHDLMEEQYYRASYWRVASNEVNYRRFFSINELGGLKVETKEVFDAIHKKLFSLIDKGQIQGVRLDHVDGLYHPRQYLERLRAEISAVRGRRKKHKADDVFYTVVEKILAPSEGLREDWPVDGTTGYDFMNRLGGIFVDPAAEKPLTSFYARLTGAEADFHEMRYKGLLHVMENELAAELTGMSTLLSQIAEMSLKTRDFTFHDLRDGLRELVACFPVYRTYVTRNRITQEDRAILDHAVREAKRRNATTNPDIYDFIRAAMSKELIRDPEATYSREKVISFAMRVQQFTGPAMAKGMEDTAFYRYNRLLCLNEVGGEPGDFGVSVADFHENMVQQAEKWPHTMLATSTHDTKRGEDGRMRIAALSELASDFIDVARHWTDLNRRLKTVVDGDVWPTSNDEYMLYQGMIGMWPLDMTSRKNLTDDGVEDLRNRLKAFMMKAMREAKSMTDWPVPNMPYEDAVMAFIDRILVMDGDNPFLDDFLPFVRTIAGLGALNSLSQTLVKLAVPGVPDIYRGCENWDFSLVDPDNRRPVDHARLSGFLGQIEESFADQEAVDLSSLRGVVENWRDGRIKLYLTWRLLNWRKETPDLFLDGDYIPLAVEGDGRDRIIAFARKADTSVGIFVAPRLCATSLPGDKAPVQEVAKALPADLRIVLPEELADIDYRDILSGTNVKAVQRRGDSVIAIRPLLQHFPVSALRG